MTEDRDKITLSSDIADAIDTMSEEELELYRQREQELQDTFLRNKVSSTIPGVAGRIHDTAYARASVEAVAQVLDNDEVWQINGMEDLVTQRIPALTESESYVFYTAFMYYTKLVYAARKYVKMYVKNEKSKLSIWRTLNDPSKGQRSVRKFNPFVYNIKLSNILPSNNIIYHYIADTSAEAVLNTAYFLGFATAPAFTKLRSKYHSLAMNKIESDSKYMDYVRLKLKFEEHTRQINQAVYALPKYKQMWKQDLINTFQTTINNVERGL